MKVLSWFLEKRPKLVTSMKNCSHHIVDNDPSKQSPYHMEGDVYTHTLMVYAFAQQKSIELKLAALLHDIGKPGTAHIKDGKNRVSFTDHESHSSVLALEILNEFERDFGISLNKENIIKAINWHSVLQKLPSYDEETESAYLTDEAIREINLRFGDDIELYSLCADLAMADNQGRISEDINIAMAKQSMLQNFIPMDIRYQENNPEQKTFTMTIGLPGAGKTSFVKENIPDAEYFSVDDILMTDMNPNGYTYQQVWSKDNYKKALELMYERMKKAFEENKDVVVDMVNVDSKIRQRILNMVPFKYRKEAYVFFTEMETLIKRNVKREKEGRSVPINVIMDMSLSLEIPFGDQFDQVEIVLG